MPTTLDDRTIERYRSLGIPVTDEDAAEQRDAAYRSTLTEQFRFHARDLIRQSGWEVGGSASYDAPTYPYVRAIAAQWFAERARQGRTVSDDLALVMYDAENHPVRMICSRECLTRSSAYDELLYDVTAERESYASRTFSSPQWRVMRHGSLLHREAVAALSGEECLHCDGPLDPSAPARGYCDDCSCREVLTWHEDSQSDLCSRCIENTRSLDDLCLGCGDIAHAPAPWCSGVNAVSLTPEMLVLAGAITRAAGADPQQTVLWSDVELSQSRGQIALDEDEESDYTSHCVHDDGYCCECQDWH